MYLAKKKVLTVGGGFDAQSNYKAFAGTSSSTRPVGAGGFHVEGDSIHYDGEHFPDLPKQNDWLAQAGYLFARPR